MRIGVAGSRPALVPLLGRLVRAGHSVAALRDTEPTTADADAAPEVPFVHTVAELCADREVLLTKFANDDVLVNTSLGAGGLCTAMAPGSIHVVLGAHDSALIDQLASAHAERGQQLVAATILPPTGQDPLAVVGGPASAVQRITPLFDDMLLRHFSAGESASVATTLALAHFAVLGCAIQAIAEAFALARSYGVNVGLMHDVMVDGLFAAPAYRHYGSRMVQEAYTPGVTAHDAERAMIAALAIAERHRIPLPAIDACRDRLLGARAHGDGDRDWTVLNREQTRSGGLS